MDPVNLDNCDLRPDLQPAIEALTARGWHIELDRLAAGAFKRRKSGALLKHPSIFILTQPENRFRPFYVRSCIHPPAKAYDSAHQAALRFIELCMMATPADKHND